MSWTIITSEWRLKLLALVLAVLMLGAVAFSQNPPTSKDLMVGISYNIAPDSPVVVINQPTTVKVKVTGLADALQTVTPQNVSATIDLTKATPGAASHVNLVVRSAVPGTQVQKPVVPYILNIDKRESKKLKVNVRVLHTVSGWNVTNQEARCPGSPCEVTFTGPTSFATNLQAYADFTSPVQQNSEELFNQPVILEQNGQRLDLGRPTAPGMTLDPLNVSVLHVDAVAGTAKRQVTLVDPQPVRPPAPGYRVTNVVVNPITVTISGPTDLVKGVTVITLPPVDLGGRTSDATFTVAIPYPDGTDGSVKNAKVTYSIVANPNTTP